MIKSKTNMNSYAKYYMTLGHHIHVITCSTIVNVSAAHAVDIWITLRKILFIKLAGIGLETHI